MTTQPKAEASLTSILSDYIASAQLMAWVDLRDQLTPFLATSLPLAKLDEIIHKSVENHILTEPDPIIKVIRDVRTTVENMSVSVRPSMLSVNVCLSLTYVLRGDVKLAANVVLATQDNQITSFVSAHTFLNPSDGVGRHVLHSEGKAMMDNILNLKSTTIRGVEFEPGEQAPSRRQKPVRITVEGPAHSGKSMVLSVIARALSNHGVRGAQYFGFDEMPVDFFAKAHSKDVAELLSFASISATELNAPPSGPGGQPLFLKERLEQERINSLAMRQHDQHKPVLSRTMEELAHSHAILTAFITQLMCVEGLNWTDITHPDRNKGRINSDNAYPNIELVTINHTHFVLMRYLDEAEARSMVSVKLEVRAMNYNDTINYDVIHVEHTTHGGDVMVRDFILESDYMKFSNARERVPNEVFHASRFIKQLLTTF